MQQWHSILAYNRVSRLKSDTNKFADGNEYAAFIQRAAYPLTFTSVN
jgi:hypothetical protein